jgi:hypothetical protein
MVVDEFIRMENGGVILTGTPRHWFAETVPHPTVIE